AVERASLVAADDPADAGVLEGARHGHPGCAAARRDDADVLDLLADDAERVEQRREDDDRRAVLVVVEDRDVETLPQPCLDREAARRGDVLEVDAAEDGRDRLDDADDLVLVLRVEADREGVDVGELLEEHGLALHDRQRALGPDVAETEDGGSVADDGDRVALDREVPDLLRVGGDGARHAGHARRVDHREILTGLERHARLHLELAAEVGEEDAVGDVHNLDSLDSADGGDDRVEMLLVVGEDVDVAALRVALDVDEVDRAEQSSGLADRRAEAPGWFSIRTRIAALKDADGCTLRG